MSLFTSHLQHQFEGSSGPPQHVSQSMSAVQSTCAFGLKRGQERAVCQPSTVSALLEEKQLYIVPCFLGRYVPYSPKSRSDGIHLREHALHFGVREPHCSHTMKTLHQLVYLDSEGSHIYDQYEGNHFSTTLAAYRSDGLSSSHAFRISSYSSRMRTSTLSPSIAP
jgi:hypothetical protein